MNAENQNNQSSGQTVPTTRQNYNNALGMDSSEFLGRILNNEHIPSEVKNNFWALFSGSQKLTFLNENDVRRYLLRFKLMRYAIIRSIPKSTYKYDLTLDLLNAETEFENNLRKALGDNKMNFMELLMSTLHINFAERTIGQNSSDNVSFVKRLTNAIQGVK